MDTVYKHQEHESKITALWDEHSVAKPRESDSAKPAYSILLPPPNANASLHAGHAMFVIEDILIRWKRLQGFNTVWIPGTDHAGFETQYVYEKHLAKQGKSRFNFDRQTLYKDIYAFVQENSGLIEDQLKQLGFSLDWSRKTFMLDEKVIKTVYETFSKMIKDGLIYRDNYIVNYSPKSGTTFSELEVTYVERKDPLYFIKYGPFTIATVRPETKFRDVALAANPLDPRYKKWIGKTITFEGLLGPVEMIVLGDEDVDMEFGTGIMKVTPAHDAHDFALGKKHNLPVTPIIDTFGRMDFSWYINDSKNTNPIFLERAKKYHGKKVAEARKLIAQDMLDAGMIEKIDANYTHNVAVDYKTGGDIEPLVLPNWFVCMKPLAEKAAQAARDKQVTFVPARFEQEFYNWMDKIRDWPISRQIVWGIRIPVWYSTKTNPNLEITFLNSAGERVIGVFQDLVTKGFSLTEIKSGLQQLRAPLGSIFEVCADSPGEDYLPETDTFDTWFSSGQWPLTTLGFPDSQDFKTYYPTSVLDTMWDILFFWVARMIMFGLYLTNQVPFKTVYLHSMVTDEKGQKMSKSKGNVINPLEIVNEFGADALRMALVAGSTPGNPIALSKEKVKGYRNFTNKLWNIARFILLQQEQSGQTSTSQDKPTEQDLKILEKLETLTSTVTKSLNKYRFSDAALALYDFLWNEVASTYLENNKARSDKQVVFQTLSTVFARCLTLLHPFMPFITETLWQELRAQKVPGFEQPVLALAEWPKYE